MRFKICSVGWNCGQFIQQTLNSVEGQSLENWDMAIVYDPSDDDGAKIIRDWCKKDPEHRLYRINKERRFAPRNQYEAVYEMLKPEDDDVIIFLDLDGDRLAHSNVLRVLSDAYQEGALVTYGQYRPVPPTPGHKEGMAREWPKDVVQTRSYRQYTLANGPCFNHLRTVSWKVFQAIPQSYFKWEGGDWYKGATDYVVMIPALELANGKHKFIEEVILNYNHANPLADNTNTYQEGRPGHDATLDVLQRQRLDPLPETGALHIPIPDPPRTKPIYGRDAPGSNDIYLSADQRREILRAYGRHFELKFFVETGTNDGGTPWELKDDFEELWTIELSRRLWREACARFSRFPKVHCLHGDSGQVLGELLPSLPGPALFWLDGHYSGGVTAHGDLDTPVVQELETLVQDPRPHVILVDDARIFAEGEEHDMYPHYGDYPAQSWVKEFAEKHGYDFLLLDDIMRLTPNALFRGKP